MITIKHAKEILKWVDWSRMRTTCAEWSLFAHPLGRRLIGMIRKIRSSATGASDETNLSLEGLDDSTPITGEALVDYYVVLGFLLYDAGTASEPKDALKHIDRQRARIREAMKRGLLPRQGEVLNRQVPLTRDLSDRFTLLSEMALADDRRVEDENPPDSVS